MKWWILSILITATIVAVGGEQHRDYSLSKLVENNDLLTEINVQRKKVSNFIERWGNFYGYVIPELKWYHTKFTGSQSHRHSDHSPTMVIETEVVTHLEQLNGYLDYVIDTKKMDSITA